MGLGIMAEYRIYTLDERGGLHGAEELFANGDRRALEEARLKRDLVSAKSGRGGA